MSPAQAVVRVVGPADIAQLQRSHGNRHVQRLLASAHNPARPPVIQRGLFDAVGDLWENVKDVAGEVWETLTETGDGKKVIPKQGPPPPQPGEVLTVKDPLAYVRTPPPALKSTGATLPVDRQVEILTVHEHGSKTYVEVREQLPEGIISASMQGWTLASNLSHATAPPEPEEPGNKIDDIDVIDDPERTDDATKRASAAEMATLSETDLAELEELGGREGVIGEMGNQAAAVAEKKAEIKALNKDRTLNREEKKARQAELKAAIKEHAWRINELDYLLAKVDMTNELDTYGSTPEKWFADLYPNATFLGIPITGNRTLYKKKGLGGVHKELYLRLKEAEKTLEGETGLPLDEIAVELKVRKVSGLRHPTPATGSSEGVGLHSYGLAVDINADRSNPYLGFHKKADSEPVVGRATQLIRGAAFVVREKAPKGEGKDARERRLRSPQGLLRVPGGDDGDARRRHDAGVGRAGRGVREGDRRRQDR